VSSPYNLVFRPKAVHSLGNPPLNGRSMTSPVAHPLNPRCLILPILLPTVSNMISHTGHSHSPRTVSLTIHHPLLKFLLPHDHRDRRVRIISRVSRLAWRTPRGRSFQLPCGSTKLITMIGKTMLCSSAMVLQVRSHQPPESRSGNTRHSPGNRIERCLSYDEKPLLLFQKLKDASKNPVFMLKHIKDIRSPIAVAQQKQAARKASGDSSTSKPKSSTSHARTPSRPPRLQVHPDASANVVPPLMTGTSAQPGWPEVMSPAADNKDREDTTDRERLKGASGSEPPKSGVPHTASASASSASDHNEIGTPAREVPAEISYAVAIYPYMAEQEDEFDVVVYVFLFLHFHELNHE
jgi:hypothetical protein